MMSGQRRYYTAWAAAGAIVALVLVFVAFGEPIARSAALEAAHVAGFDLTYRRFEIHPGAFHGEDLVVRSRAGEPIATIASLDVAYSVRDLLPGSAHRFGVRSFDIERPHVTLIRHKDGSWNIPMPARQTQQTPSSVPLALDGRVRDGSIDVYDAAQGVAAARRLRARALAADLHLASNARTTYAAHVTYEEDGRAFPIEGRGAIDVAAGIGDQRWTAAHLPIARIVDFALNSPSMHLADGSLDALDARIVGLRDSDGSLREHPAVTAYLRDARLAIGGIPKPLRHVSGPISLYGDGLVLHALHGTLADVPISIGGGVYDLVSPRLELTVRARGPLERLRQALAQTTSLPLRGDAAIALLVEGAASKPLMFVSLDAPSVHYRDVPFDRIRGTVAFDGQEADVARFELGYAGMRATARGRLALAPRANALQVVASLDAPRDAIPYARAFVPGMPVHATIVATGNTLASADTRGVLSGRADASELLGTFDVRSDGVGTLGPLRIREPHGSLYAIASVDHPRDRASAFLDARGVRFDTRAARALPGVNVPSLPAAVGTLDGRVVATVHRASLASTGFATVSNLETAYGRVARTSLRFATDARSTTAVAVDASGIGKIGALASAALSYRNGGVTIHTASIEAGPNVASARGSIATGGSAPRYDVNARLHSADLTALAALAAPSRAAMLEGSADAAMRVRGSGAQPAIAGSVHSHEGAVNGLAFSGARADISGTPSRLDVTDGNVGVGSTQIAFAGSAGSSGGSVRVRAPRADLADFNDFFDAGDMLGGQGSLAASASFGAAGLGSTSGAVDVRDARVRNFQLGTTVARWDGTAEHIGGDVAIRGAHGRATARGIVATSGAMNVTARVRGLDLAAWLPMAGIVAPVTGIADADVAARGVFPALDADVRAHLARGSVGRVPVRRADAALALRNGRGRLDAFAVDVPNARMTGSGRFGLRSGDPLALAFDARTASVRAFARTLGVGALNADGALSTHALVTGSLRAPRLDERFALANGRYGQFVIPRAVADVRADARSIALRSSEIDLARGRILARALVPITLSPFAIDPRDRAISGRLVADDVEAGDFAPLMPPTTHVTGRLDGTVDVRGTVHAPRFGGSLALANASYSGPAERVPITGGRALLAFSGTTIALRNAHADAGGGTLDANGSASVPNVRDLSAVAFDVRARAAHTFLDLPQYAKGRFDADVRASRAAGRRPQLSGTLAMRNARIPVAALYNPSASTEPQAPRPDVGLALQVLADRDVRVVSPNVDVGATGFVNVNGTLAAPQLDGNFVSTGGTVSFYRTLRVERGTVAFSPGAGLVPTVDAVASTTIADPATDIVMHVSGPATGMNLDFASSPSYDREQILALLVDGGGGAMRQSAVAQLASGEVNTLFTRNVLEPFSAQLGEGLGLQNLQITSDLQSGLGINAVKGIGKNLNAVYADTFGLPRRESLSLQTRYASKVQYAFTMFNTQGGTIAGMEQPVLINALSIGNAATTAQSTGGQGFDFQVKRTYP